MVAINLLQIGQENWATTVTMPQGLVWHYCLEADLPDYLMQLKASKQAEMKPSKQSTLSDLTFDAVLLTSPVSEANLSPLMDCVEAYALFQTPDLQLQSSMTRGLFRRKRLRTLPVQSDRQATVDQLCLTLFRDQYGDRLTVADMEVSPQFKGKRTYKGYVHLAVSGAFGDDFQPLVTYRYNILSLPMPTEIWQEYTKEGECDILLEIIGLERGSAGRIAKVITLSEEQLADAFVLVPDQTIESYAVTIYAKGEGELRFGPLHKRHSRMGLGKFLLGGCTVSDANRQECHYYFNPGDMKPPLTVYFSGYRPAEGFEGFYMMKALKGPFMLISDPRLEGGCFYVGSEEYEANIRQAIQTSLDDLGFTSDQLILTGISMGSYGALYHAAHFTPHAVVVSKPFTNLGKTVRGLKFRRPDEFETSADMLLSLMGSTDELAIQGLTQSFWDSFKTADFSKTRFAVSYMLQDDYDDTAVQELIAHLAEQDSVIYAKGYEGRHNDNNGAVLKWFLTQLGKIMVTDFGRKES